MQGPIPVTADVPGTVPATDMITNPQEAKSPTEKFLSNIT